jgi:hypothetical protein
MKDQWHEAFPATFDEIRDDKNEVKRQNIIWEVVKSHMDFCEDLLTVKNVSLQITKNKQKESLSDSYRKKLIRMLFLRFLTSCGESKQLIVRSYFR